MNTRVIEQIKRDIEAGTEDAKTMGLDCPIVIVQPGGKDVMTRFSRDTSRRNNGGEYDYWTEYRIRGGHLFVKEASSCDFWQPEQEWRDFGPMTYNELSKLVQ